MIFPKNNRIANYVLIISLILMMKRRKKKKEFWYWKISLKSIFHSNINFYQINVKLTCD